MNSHTTRRDRNEQCENGKTFSSGLRSSLGEGTVDEIIRKEARGLCRKARAALRGLSREPAFRECLHRSNYPVNTVQLFEHVLRPLHQALDTERQEDRRHLILEAISVFDELANFAIRHDTSWGSSYLPYGSPRLLGFIEESLRAITGHSHFPNEHAWQVFHLYSAVDEIRKRGAHTEGECDSTLATCDAIIVQAIAPLSSGTAVPVVAAAGAHPSPIFRTWIETHWDGVEPDGKLTLFNVLRWQGEDGEQATALAAKYQPEVDDILEERLAAALANPGFEQEHAADALVAYIRTHKEAFSDSHVRSILSFGEKQPWEFDLCQGCQNPNHIRAYFFDEFSEAEKLIWGDIEGLLAGMHEAGRASRNTMRAAAAHASSRVIPSITAFLDEKREPKESLSAISALVEMKARGCKEALVALEERSERIDSILLEPVLGLLRGERLHDPYYPGEALSLIGKTGSASLLRRLTSALDGGWQDAGWKRAYEQRILEAIGDLRSILMTPLDDAAQTTAQ